MKIEDKTMRALRSSLNFRQYRQEVIASNIANTETPGFKAKRLKFEEALSRAIDIDGERKLQTNHSKHIHVGGGGFDNLNSKIIQTEKIVDRDEEMARMARNKILFDASVQLLNKKLGLLKYTITSER